MNGFPAMPLTGQLNSLVQKLSTTENGKELSITTLFGDYFSASLGATTKSVLSNSEATLPSFLAEVKALLQETGMSFEDLEALLSKLSQIVSAEELLLESDIPVEEKNDVGDGSEVQLQQLVVLVSQLMTLSEGKQSSGEVAKSSQQELRVALQQLLGQTEKPIQHLTHQQTQQQATKTMPQTQVSMMTEGTVPLQRIEVLVQLANVKNKLPDQWETLKAAIVGSSDARKGIESKWTHQGEQQRWKLLEGQVQQTQPVVPVHSEQGKGTSLHTALQKTETLPGASQTQRPVLEQLQQAFKHHFSARPEALPTRLTIQLQPENLGQVTLRLTQTNQGIVALVTAHVTQTKELLESNLHQLRNALGQQNIQIDRIEIAQADDTERSLTEQHTDDQQQSSDQEQGTSQEADAETSRFIDELEQELLNLRV
ncbi:flagellar hook-length control protein FliK [Aureibacillus halotolerans]|uniref:Flagellar hook-length control protein FliK n=1 Tax=Aureibacillus halotolerans TaxID=1508390 RepID=A0A4R6U124_9BACI|nr:flagellar hook-length control protein FliK [Aureibacillus halotolerans]TDQ39651.1 flagellar hook-length control protein FliK [Aureibacillus halotolerans]